MTKQEEIREGIEVIIRKGIQASNLGEHRSLANTVADVLNYLHSAGCVLKVSEEFFRLQGVNTLSPLAIAIKWRGGEGEFTTGATVEEERPIKNLVVAELEPLIEEVT